MSLCGIGTVQAPMSEWHVNVTLQITAWQCIAAHSGIMGNSRMGKVPNQNLIGCSHSGT